MLLSRLNQCILRCPREGEFIGDRSFQRGNKSVNTPPLGGPVKSLSNARWFGRTACEAGQITFPVYFLKLTYVLINVLSMYSMSVIRLTQRPNWSEGNTI